MPQTKDIISVFTEINPHPACSHSGPKFPTESQPSIPLHSPGQRKWRHTAGYHQPIDNNSAHASLLMPDFVCSTSKDASVYVYIGLKSLSTSGLVIIFKMVIKTLLHLPTSEIIATRSFPNLCSAAILYLERLAAVVLSM